MILCKLCTKQIPIKVKIDGQIRNLQRRKYCLDCSPFKSNNRGDPRRIPFRETLRTCGGCSNEIGQRRKFCTACISKKTRFKRKKWAVELLGGKCIKCGYKKNLCALHFHHRDPTQKEFGISKQSSHISFEKFKNEILKCDLLCANCHAEEHWNDSIYEQFHTIS